MISPACATASNSISFAFSRNLEITTGYSFDTFAAMPRKCSISCLVWQTRMAGSRKHVGRSGSVPGSLRGRRIRSRRSSTKALSTAAGRCRGCRASTENLCRFSARSIETADVPRMGTFWRWSFMARLFGIWPPTETITPLGCSRSITSSTRSSDSSSK